VDLWVYRGLAGGDFGGWHDGGLGASVTFLVIYFGKANDEKSLLFY
jgi:hypothetical protein